MLAASANTRLSRETIPARDGVCKLTDERKLLAAAQKGDMRAFNHLVQLYQGVAYHTAFRVLGDFETAADATQEAFIAAYKHLYSFRGGSFKAWLLRIVTNACYDQLRDKQRHPTVSLETLAIDPDRHAPEPEPARSQLPEDFLERLELREAIQSGLQTLPLEQRVTVVLSDVDGLAYREIAQITDTNLGTVKSRLARARSHLRVILTQKGFLPQTH